MRIYKISQQYDTSKLQDGITALQQMSQLIQQFIEVGKQTNNFNISELVLTAVQSKDTVKLDRALGTISEVTKQLVAITPRIINTGLNVDIQGVIQQALSGNNQSLINIQDQIQGVLRNNLKGATI